MASGAAWQVAAWSAWSARLPVARVRPGYSFPERTPWTSVLGRIEKPGTSFPCAPWGGVQGPAGGKPGPTKLWTRGQGDHGGASCWKQLAPPNLVSCKSPFSLPPQAGGRQVEGVWVSESTTAWWARRKHMGPHGRIGPQRDSCPDPCLPSCPAAYPRLPPALHHAVVLPSHGPPAGELSGPPLLLGRLCKIEGAFQISASRPSWPPRWGPPSSHRGHAAS